MRFKDNTELQDKILQRRREGATIDDIAREFPQYAHITYKRFLKGSGKNYSRAKMSAACKKAWVDKSEESKEKHIEHLRKLAASQRGVPAPVSPSHLEKIRDWTSSEKNRQRVALQNKKKKKYTVDKISSFLKQQGVTFEGDLSDSENMITIIFDDGQKKRIQIKKMMLDNKLDKPKLNDERILKAIKKRELVGLTFDKIDENYGLFSYKGYKWKQRISSFSFSLKQIRKIEIGLQIQELMKSGMSLYRAALTMRVNPATFARHFKQTGCVVEAVRTIKNYEKILLINNCDVIYDRQLPGYKIRPDLRIESKKLIIEVDGLYTHSDEFKPKTYHYDRYQIYKQEGYSFLCFTESEVLNKRPIVNSMINNKLGLSKRIFARECTCKELSPQEANVFFDENHLMGTGFGKTIALSFNGDVVCAVRYFIQKGEVHVSRYCNKIDHAVVGGYEKLLARLPQNRRIVNFVDVRHGSGEHLLKKGFHLVSSHIGMWWIERNKLVNRRKYLGNSGYDHGLWKYWDYGQLKYVREPLISDQT